MKFRLTRPFVYMCLVLVEVTYGSVRNVTSCGRLKCSQHSECVHDSNGYSCKCYSGYTGVECIEDQDECALSSWLCRNRGPCYNTLGSWRCDCLTGWFGDHCEQKNESSSVWLCMPGWMGDECFDHCLPNNSSSCGQTQICANRGTHRYQGRSYYSCYCKDGWTGSNCTDLDECLSNPCTSPKNNCVNSPGSFDCHCPSGWQGNMCTDDVDECASNTCQHAKLCANTLGSYNCTCLEGWGGIQCSEDINECQSKPCELSQECVNTLGSFQCQARNELGYPDVPPFSFNKLVMTGTFLIPIIIVVAVIVIGILIKNKRISGQKKVADKDSGRPV